MYCKYCGFEVEDSALDCPACLSSLRKITLCEAGGRSQEEVTAKMKKEWNWGAFLLAPIWSVAHGVWIGLLSFIPILGVAMMVLLGLNGNRWAWEKNDKHLTPCFFLLKELRWSKAAFLVIGGVVLVTCAALIFSSSMTDPVRDSVLLLICIPAVSLLIFGIIYNPSIQSVEKKLL